MGIGVIDALNPTDLHAEDWLTIQTRPGVATGERLKELYEDLSGYIRNMKPDIAVVEKLFFGTNVQTAMGVSEARGIALLALAEAGIPILEPTPSELKATISGDGRADKLQMQTMIKMLLKLDHIPTPDDAADALCLAAYGALQYNNRRMLMELVP